jgi:flagellar basal-body rod protein FlgB
VFVLTECSVESLTVTLRYIAVFYNILIKNHFSKTGTLIADPTAQRVATRIVKGTAMPISDGIFGPHATALKLREQRMNMLASNIANAATPNYKARDFDFSEALKSVEAGGSSDSTIQYRIPVQPSLDGNTVELATEQTAFAENTLGYRSSLSFLQGRISTLSRALKGE